MTCPRCKAEMNHHADKIDYIAVLTGDEPIDTELGGVLREIHTCPQCGNVETQTAKLSV